MADVSHNPFRTPAASPNSTGNQQYAPPGNPPPSQQQYSPPSAPHPVDPVGLTEEAPPAYTTRPDVYQGESTVEFGPSRPFQPAPPPPQNSGWTPQTQASASPTPSLWQQLTGQMSGMSMQSAPPSPSSGWSTAYPGRQQQPPPQMHVQPPPQPQQQPPLTTHLSEFARDFYATTSVPPSGFSDVSGARGAGASAVGYPPPPPGAPSSPSGGSGAGLPDDGRPTRTPVPGHPLLHEGNLLVYPPYHECSKCNNTGYKHGDPMHPCNKCWSRYARPYAGAVASSFPPPSSSSASGFASPNTGSTTFQRPLPRLYAPSPSPSPGAHSSSSAYPPSPGGLYPERDLAFGLGRHGRSRSAGSLRRGEGLLGSLRREVTDAIHGNGGPGMVYAPGDVRMGGTPCWRCSGRGTLSFLVFETVPCGVCRGVGRVFG
ncbi:hypothetical protein C8F04DRAFT_1221471 [Mycena alexandri]|uniref:Uncharacterized protein n=1 Tax=Mycena alexandri TaxID=1745969 RepID=A0AAD6SXB4_9AGAR|nr:hypothetical protein C8F04DRAFT_1221471 [Mycena alexandri]